MLLADNAEGIISSNLHHFLYAQALGAYHINAIYMGPGMHDLKLIASIFCGCNDLRVVNPGSSEWSTSKLDLVHFPPMNKNDSFGFVDPKYVLHGCHILPAFTKENDKRVGLVSCIVPRMVKITTNTSLTSEFIVHLLVPIQCYPQVF